MLSYILIAEIIMPWNYICYENKTSKPDYQKDKGD